MRDHVVSGDPPVLDRGRLDGLNAEGPSGEIAPLTNITSGKDIVRARIP